MITNAAAAGCDLCVCVCVCVCFRCLWQLLPLQTAPHQRFTLLITLCVQRMHVFSGLSSSWYVFVTCTC